MKFVIIVAAIAILGVASASPAKEATDASEAKNENMFTKWQKAFQDTLSKLMGGKKEAEKKVAKRDLLGDITKNFQNIKSREEFEAAMGKTMNLLKAAIDGKKVAKRDLVGSIMSAAMHFNNPIALAQDMFNIMNELNKMGQNKAGDATAAAGGAAAAGGDMAAQAIALLTKANDPVALAGEIFKIVGTLANQNQVVLPQEAKAKMNFFQNPILKNPNWNTKKPAAEATPVAEEVAEEVVEEVVEVEDSTDAPLERQARREYGVYETDPNQPSFKNQMKANAYGIIGIGNLLEYLDEKKAAKAAAAAKSKREEAATPAPAAASFDMKDFGKMVSDFYAQFQAPAKKA